MTKEKLPNGDSVEVIVTDKGIVLCKYDKTGVNITNRTGVSLGDEQVKLPFLCLVERGGYCVLWLQETSKGFVINIRKYTGLGLAGKITTLDTKNTPDGDLLNVLVQNGSLLTVEWSSDGGMFSGIFNVDGSIHTKETKIIHNTETLKEDLGKPTQENIKIEIVENSTNNREINEPVKSESIATVTKETKKAPLEIMIPPVLQEVKQLSIEEKQEKPAPVVPQTPRRGVPMKFTGINSGNHQEARQVLSMNTRPKQRTIPSMGMRFM